MMVLSTPHQSAASIAVSSRVVDSNVNGSQLRSDVSMKVRAPFAKSRTDD